MPGVAHAPPEELIYPPSMFALRPLITTVGVYFDMLSAAIAVAFDKYVHTLGGEKVKWR